MAGEINTQTVIDELLPALHSSSRANLTFWSEQDLEEWIDDSLKRLSRVCGIFVERSADNTTVNGTSSYLLPTRHVATLHVSYGTRPLRPANSIELEMRNPSYRTVPATVALPPSYWYEDLEGNATLRITPVPIAAVSLPIICTVFPTEVDTAESNTLVQAPAPVAGYLAMYTLSKAFGKEGESEMPDVGMHCAARCEMYEQLLQSYYGPGC